MDIRDLTYSYFARKKTTKFLPNDYFGHKIIELGAGLDNYSELFKKSLFVALDIDDSIAKQFRNFVKADIRKLPLKENSFDFFIANNVLEHIENPEAVLKQLQKSCRKGGLVILPVLDAFPKIYDPKNWHRVRNNKPLSKFGIGGFGHVSIHHSNKWKSIFSDCGFKIVQEKQNAQDIWSCIEFCVCSIFFSHMEYNEFSQKRNTGKIFTTLKKLMPVAKRLLYPIYWLLNKVAWKPKGYITVAFDLRKNKPDC